MTQTDYGSVPSSGECNPLRQPNDDGNGYVINIAHENEHELHRHLTLFDLVSVGVGATVGSGVFVLVGLIAHSQAGPSVSISWLIAGVAATASGICYAELGGRFPSAGSSYVYAKETMGDYAAVIAGACLTLEYTGSASAVARSWGDKVVEYVKSHEAGDESWYQVLTFFLDPGFGISTCAFLVSLGAVLLLHDGVKESKFVTNFFSMLNVSLVFFMAAMSLVLVKRENMTPLAPFGAGGIVRGATSSFFGYIGFDEICCMSGEAINPSKNVPRAICITLLIVTTLYCAASLGLAGMVPYQYISESSGFPEGFRYRGYYWVAEITALGELTVLPLVVLVTIMAQPRLNYTMAMDGVLPSVFAEVDEDGNLKPGIKIAGAIMIIIATAVPFSYLDDLISSGILVAFTITDSSVILVRRESPHGNPYLLERMLAAFLILSLLSGFLLRNCLSTGVTGHAVRAMTLFSCLGTLFIGNRIRTHCPKKKSCSAPNVDLFLTPFVPILPLCGCFVNLYLIAQLEITGLAAIFGYIGLAILFCYLNKRRQHEWHRSNCMQVENTIRNGNEPPERMISMQDYQDGN
ncbi:hypothetical protein ACHAXR_004958 [Thalassiosira sp. AJA248-18]